MGCPSRKTLSCLATTLCVGLMAGPAKAMLLGTTVHEVSRFQETQDQPEPFWLQYRSRGFPMPHTYIFRSPSYLGVEVTPDAVGTTFVSDRSLEHDDFEDFADFLTDGVDSHLFIGGFSGGSVGRYESWLFFPDFGSSLSRNGIDFEGFFVEQVTMTLVGLEFGPNTLPTQDVKPWVGRYSFRLDVYGHALPTPSTSILVLGGLLVGVAAARGRPRGTGLRAGSAP